MRICSKEVLYKAVRYPLYRYRRHDKNMTNNKKKMKQHHQKIIFKHGKINVP